MVKATVCEFKGNNDIPSYTDTWIEKYRDVNQLFQRLTEGKDIHDVTKVDENHLLFGFYRNCDNKTIYTQYELIGT